MPSDVEIRGTGSSIPSVSLVTPDGTTITGAGVDSDRLRINPQGAADAIAPFLSSGAPDPSRLAYTYEDFENGRALIGGNSGNAQLSVSIEVGGSSAVFFNTFAPDAYGVLVANASPGVDVDAFCFWNIGGIATSTGGTFTTEFGPTTADFSVEIRAAIDPSPVDGMIALFGMPSSDSVPPDFSAGIAFEVNPATHGNANWWIDGVDTGVAAAQTPTWQRLKIVIPAPGTVANCYIANRGEDFVLVHSMAAPATTYVIGGGASATALAGSLFASYADYVLVLYPVDRR